MATRVIAAQDKAISGAGDDVQIKAGNANTSGAGGHIIIQPGAQATTGGNGLLIIRQPSGVAGTDELQLSHDGGKGSVINKDGVLQLGGSHIALRTVANNAKANLTAGTIYCDALYSSDIINADGQTNDSYSWGIDSSAFNWNQNFHIRVGWAHIKGYSNCGIAYTGSNTNGRRATLEVTDGSTGGGAWAYRSSTTTVNTSYNDLNLSGHSAFQRLNATATTTITGIAPASTAGGTGTPTWIHTDGRIFWLYNVGTFNITLSNENASSTAGNRVTTQTGANVVLGPGRMMQIVYDGTSSRWRTSGETYPYVFPTADGTNGQVLTTNGSGSLSWATVSAGATASGTTNYIAKFTGASTLGNSQIFDNDTNVGIGTASPSSKLDVSGTITATSININNSSSQYLNFSTNSTVRWQVYHDGSGSLRFFDNVSNNTDRMIIGNGGNIVMGAAASLDKTGGPKLLITTGPDSGGGTGAARRGLVVKGSASQTANLTEWQDSAGTIVAAVSPNGAFTGSSFTPYGTFNSTTTIFGNNYWTPNLSGVSNPSTGTFTKTAATAAWDSQVYSSEGYIKNVYCASRASQTTGHIMFGLNSDPTTDANNSSLDYAWYFRDGTVEIYESGGLVANFGSYTTSTVLSLTYDGSNVQYWKDGVIQRTVARSTGNPLYFDTSFLTQNASLNNVQFGPIGQPFGISGTSGYHPKFTSQQTLGNSIVYDNGTNVGIGTASPSSNLSIGTAAGKIGFQRGSGDGEYCTMGFKSTSGNDRYVFEINNNSGTGELRLNQGGTSTPIGMTFYTNNTEKMRIDSAGNVGIGTASPSYRLQVSGQTYLGNGASNPLYIDQTVADGVVRDSVYLYEASAQGTGRQAISWYNGNQGYYKARIYTEPGPGYAATRFYIDTADNARTVATRLCIHDGNVGINTTSPGAKLQVDTGATGTKGQIIKAFLGQTANLQEWQDSSANILGAIYANGAAFLRGVNVAASANGGTVTEVSGNYPTNNTSPYTAGAGSTASWGSGLAIDGSTNTWIDANGEGGVTFIKVVFNATYVIDRVRLAGRYDASTSDGQPQEFQLDFSDGSVQKFTFPASYTGMQEYNIRPVTTSFIRYTTISKYSTGNNGLRELEAYTRYPAVNGSMTEDRYIFNNVAKGTDVKTNVGIGTNSPGARLQIDTGVAATKGLIVRGSGSQTANLQEWQNNGGTVLAYVAANGVPVCHGGGQISTNTAFGVYALNANTTGSFNTAFGTSALAINTTGSYNTAVGRNASASSTGSFNTAVGNAALEACTSGSSNTAVGEGVLANITSTSGNSAFGRYAGLFNISSGALTGVINSIYIGYSSTGNNSATNEIVIGASAAGKGSNTTVIGNTSTTANYIFGSFQLQNSSGTTIAAIDSSGNLTAVTKSFLIDHPTPGKAAEGKKLRYASLEGPENGVYFRGTLTGDNEIILPDYWKDLVDPESITVNLTARKFAQPSLFVVDANAEKVIVESDREICCDFIVYGTRKDIAKLEVEPDGN
jgi:hypothetical protein